MTDETTPLPSADGEALRQTDARAENDERVRHEARLTALFRKYATTLAAYARTLGSREPADAEDAVQATFLRLLSTRRHLLDTEGPDTDSDLHNVLRTGVRGRMRNHGRDEAVRQEYHVQLDPPHRSEELCPPDQVVEYHELLEHYSAALTLLSPRERQVYHFIREEGYTYTQVAAELGISVGAAKTYFSRAIEKLTEALAEWL